jgi:hypothetical protein
MGKSNPTPAPDYEPLANASREAAEVQAKLGREQLDFAKEQYDRTAPMLERVANQQMASRVTITTTKLTHLDLSNVVSSLMRRDLTLTLTATSWHLKRRQTQVWRLVSLKHRTNALWRLWGLTLIRVVLQGCSKPLVYLSQQTEQML